jgi:hypothetical protein
MRGEGSAAQRQGRYTEKRGVNMTRGELRRLALIRSGVLDPGPRLALIGVFVVCGLGAFLLVWSIAGSVGGVVAPEGAAGFGVMFWFLGLMGRESYVASTLIRKLDQRLRDADVPV